MTITIIAAANGNLNPLQVQHPETVQNGDFLISATTAGTVGDGDDEYTRWTFDFNSDPNHIWFSQAQGLSSAKLTLTLTPKNDLISSDSVSMVGITPAIAGPIQALPNDGLSHTIVIDLLAEPGYTPSAILGLLFGQGFKIPMLYQDDAVVSYAMLQLTQALPAFQYAVKIICGKSEGPVAAKGTYYTAINVHNPHVRVAAFRKKFAEGLPHERAGAVTRFFDARLEPDRALEIDNEDILKHMASADGVARTFLKGFAILESNVELDVVAVYTAAGRDGMVTSIHTERVAPRRRGPGRIQPLTDLSALAPSAENS